MDPATPAVVTGTDGSPSAEAALVQAAGLARSERSELHVVSAYAAGDAAARERALAALDAARELLAGDGLEIEVHGVEGDPAGALVEIAQAVDARLIVVGNRGTETLLPWRRAIFEDVERRAGCPVLVVDTEDWWRTDRAAEPGRRPRLGREWRVLLVTMTAVFMALLDVTIVNVAFPDIQRDFAGTPLSGLSWVLNAYNVVFAALLIPAGRIADRIGRRRVFYSGLYVFVFGSLLCALSPNPELLVAARIVQACGAAALIPTSLGLLLPEFAPEKRATAISLWAAAGAVAAAAGPSLGGVLVDAGGWRWAFFVNLVIALGVLPGRKLLVERRDPDTAGAPDVLGAALLAAAVGLLALGIVKAPDWGWGDDRVIACWVVAALMVVWVLGRSRRHPSPVLELELLRIPSFGAASLATLVYSVSFYALLLCNVLFLTEVWGYSILEAGFGVTPGPLCAAAGAAVAGRIVEHRGPRGVVVTAALLSAIAFVLYRTLPGATPAYLTTWLPCQIVSGLGAGMVFAALSTATVTDLPANRIATGTAMASCLRQIGAVLGIAGLVAILGTPAPSELLGAFDQAYGLMIVPAVLAALLALRLPSAAAAAIGEGAPLESRFAIREVPGLTSHTAIIHGFPMVYREAGEGPPILLVHGLIDSSLTWRKVAPALGLRHRVVVPDLFGHGASAGPAGIDYSLGGHAGTLRDLLDELGLDRVTVVGHSLGGGVALDFAYLFPERVDRMVLVSPGGLGRELSPLLRAATLPGAGMLMRTFGSRASVGLLRLVAGLLELVRARGASRALVEMSRTLERLGDAGSRGAFLNTARSVIDQNGQKTVALHVLHGMRSLPMLVMWGTADRIIPATHAHAVEQHLPRAEITLLEGVGHSPQLVQPAFVADRIARFVDAPAAEPALLA
jgi:EmrB/QacA subfamily drug resistance transporter